MEFNEIVHVVVNQLKILSAMAASIGPGKSDYDIKEEFK